MLRLCDVGIMTYNEERNIGHLLEKLINQKSDRARISNIFVIASGCTDRTEEVVREYAKRDRRIRLLNQLKREGKSSAINYFISQAKENILVLESGDTYPENDTIEKLVSPFEDPDVGMTGGQIIPLNRPGSFMGFAVHLLWQLHHEISLKRPKMGELVVFRKIFQKIPKTSAVDEANIEPLIKGQGYQIRYIPEAVVYNKGPENIREFIKQRKRIYVGHLALKDNQGYMVSTLSGVRVFFTLLRHFKFTPSYIFYTPLVALLEIWARLLGMYDYYYKKDTHTIWEICESTKDLEKK